MAYLVLARKYRSTTFDEVVGQEPIARTLTNAIATGRVAHAYLFTGTRGVGKTTLARILAKALNCLASEEPTPQPCNECEACVAISRGDDMDVVEIDGASNRGIDEIRELRSNAIYRPARARYKVYYIDEVHMLTKEAFNALLKTLEEPPAHVKFIFATTEPERVPATILSRCQRFDFRNIPTRDIAGHLKGICQAEGVPADDDAIFRIARAGNGSMRDALSLLDQMLAGGSEVTDEEVRRVLGTPGEERTFALLAAVAEGDPAAALGQLDELLAAGVSLPSVMEALSDAYRQLMLALTCGADSELIELTESQRQAIGELAGRFSLPAVVHAVGVLGRASQAMRGSSVARALAEAALVRLAAAEKFTDPASLIERLESLGQSGPPSGPAGGARRGPVPARGQGGGRRPFAEGPEPPPDRTGPQAAPNRADAHPAESCKPRPSADEGPAAEAPDGGDATGHDAPAPAEAEESPSPPAVTAPQPLSTAEKHSVHQDPAVTTIRSLFGGEVVDIRRVQGTLIEEPDGQAETGDEEDTPDDNDP